MILHSAGDHRIEREPGGFQDVVVASSAILIDEKMVGGGGRRGLLRLQCAHKTNRR